MEEGSEFAPEILAAIGKQAFAASYSWLSISPSPTAYLAVRLNNIILRLQLPHGKRDGFLGFITVASSSALYNTDIFVISYPSDGLFGLLHNKSQLLERGTQASLSGN